MAKIKGLRILVSEEQDKIIEAKANSEGFRSKSDYIRWLVFMQPKIEDRIYKRLHQDE